MPTNFPIMCLICNQTLKGDAAYMNHMETFHGTTSPDQAMGVQRSKNANIPKDAPAVVLSKDAPPPDEFMEIAKMMDSPAPATPPVTSTPAGTVSTFSPPAGGPKKELTLKYKYEGNCDIHNVPIETIVIEMDRIWIANAYCLMCHEVKKQISVSPIDQPIRVTIDETVKEIREEGKDNEPKKRRAFIRNNATLPSKMRSTRLPEADKTSVPSNA